jgi:hypothetical protein
MGVAIVGIVLLALCIVPVIILQVSKNKNKDNKD